MIHASVSSRDRGLITTVALFLLSLILSSSVAAQTQDLTGASLWSFSEPSGITAMDAAHHQDGNLLNGVTRITNGKLGAALKFDGVNDYVRFDDSPWLEAAPFTVSLWLRRNGAQVKSAEILTKGKASRSYVLAFDGQSDQFVVWSIGFKDGSRATVRSVTPIADGQWMHVAGVFDGTQLALYVDGTLQGVKVVGNKAVFFDSVPLTVGGNSGRDSFKGDVDELQYYHRSLLASEVQNLFAAPKIAPTPAPTLSITSPNLGTDVWRTGQVATVTWSSNLGANESVKIELSRDGGVTYPTVLAASTPSDGSEAVTVQDAWRTNAARLRITWVNDASRSDTSDASFTITTSTSQVAFQSTLTEFPNPDRGFYISTTFSHTDYAFVAAQGVTLTRQYFRLDAYRNSALPASYLNDVSAQFAKARQAGVKMIPRFSYNFGPYPNSEPDASLPIIQQHLQQLAPILAANEDVISSMEAGFVGAWGEWHTSTNGFDTSVSAKAAVLAAVLRALPRSRMVALRYPSDMQLLNGPPIGVTEAFSSSDRARVGSHQDCFLASPNDRGTWGRSGNTYDYDKAYVAENGRYSVVGGETCLSNPPRSSCPTALSELEYMHWSYLNLQFEATVVQGFKDGGCFDEIRRRLGYRFELKSATYSTSAQRGTSLPFDFQVANAGYAAMFNERPVFAVLSNGSTRYAAQLDVDPRLWQAGTTTTIAQTITLPPDLDPGTYTLSLWLPDQALSIRDNPAFAVRFANEGVWNGTTGENIVATNVAITP